MFPISPILKTMKSLTKLDFSSLKRCGCECGCQVPAFNRNDICHLCLKNDHQGELEDPSETQYCECRSLQYISESKMIENVTYCDGIFQYVKVTDMERQTKSKKKYIAYGTVVYGIAQCPAQTQKLRDEKIEQLKEKDRGQFFENFERDYQPVAFDKCFEFDGTRKLILLGQAGCGKTHLAKATFYRFLSVGLECTWFTAPSLAELFRQMKGYGSVTDSEQAQAEKLYEKLHKDHCVFIDDLGTERITDSELFFEQFKELLDNLRKGLFVTTNLKSEERERRYGSKIEGRLMENCDSIFMQPVNYRTKSFHPMK